MSFLEMKRRAIMSIRDKVIGYPRFATGTGTVDLDNATPCKIGLGIEGSSVQYSGTYNKNVYTILAADCNEYRYYHVDPIQDDGLCGDFYVLVDGTYHLMSVEVGCFAAVYDTVTHHFKHDGSADVVVATLSATLPSGYTELPYSSRSEMYVAQGCEYYFDYEKVFSFISPVMYAGDTITVGRKLKDGDYADGSIEITHGDTALSVTVSATPPEGSTRLDEDNTSIASSQAYPSPAVSSAIENTGDTLDVTCRGKNLIPYPYYDTTMTVNGIIFTDNGDGSITANGTATANAQFRLARTVQIPNNVTLSGCPANGSVSTYYMTISLYNDTIWEKGANDTGSGGSLSINDTFYTRAPVSITIKSGTTVSNLVFKPQLETGTTATSYEPYSCNTYSIPLADTAGTTHTMRKYDKVTKHADGKWYFDSNSNSVSFDGTESWTRESPADIYTLLSNKKVCINNFITNRYVVVDSTTTYGMCGRANNTAISVFDLILAPDVDTWKSQLATWNTAGDPLTILYETATTTSYELNTTAQTALNSILSASPIAVVYSSNEVAPALSVNYHSYNQGG